MSRKYFPAKTLWTRLAAAVALVLVLAAGALADQPALKLPAGAKLVSPKQIMDTLPKTPIAVGFDVDGTLLFSSPGFYYGAMNIEGPGGSNKYGPDFQKNPAFWNDMNSRLDQFSLPKLVAAECLRRHSARGDKVYIITARPPSQGERVTALLERLFKVKLARPALFTANPDKSAQIKKLGLKVYYGDSDSDITSSLKAGARPIRVLRALNSTAPNPQHPGAKGEEILANSQR